jgi:hypothetical protein
MLNNELERMWKEAVISKFKVLSLHLPGGTKENHKTSMKVFGLLAEI